MARRKHVEDFLFLSLVLERRMGRFSSSDGDSGCSSSDSTTLASPFCLESARRAADIHQQEEPARQCAQGGQKGLSRPLQQDHRKLRAASKNPGISKPKYSYQGSRTTLNLNPKQQTTTLPATEGCIPWVFEIHLHS